MSGDNILNLYTHLLAKAENGDFVIAETLKLNWKVEDKMIDYLQKVYTILESKNDGNKIYKMEKVSIARNGEGLKNLGCFMSTFVQNNSQLFVFVDIQVDS